MTEDEARVERVARAIESASDYVISQHYAKKVARAAIAAATAWQPIETAPRDAGAAEMTVREAMIKMDTQADPVREAMRRMLAEFGDQHYHTCPTDDDSGACDCFAGHLVNECLNILATAPKT